MATHDRPLLEATMLIVGCACLILCALALDSVRAADDDPPAAPASGKADDETPTEKADEPEEELDLAPSEEVQVLMEIGLIAELEQRVEDADEAYREATKVDGDDPAPWRFLGELHRLHSGDWDQAKTCFNKALDLVEKSEPRDTVSEAVACHGLGKMLVTEENYQAGWDFFQRSIKADPTALCLRNMAIHMTYMKMLPRAQEYAKQALDLEPDSPFNRLFYAVFQALDGERAPALATLGSVDLEPALFYNVAALHAVLGNRDQAVEHLGRYLNEFLANEPARDRVRWDARGDLAFESLRRDEAFVALTRPAAESNQDDSDGAATKPGSEGEGGDE